MNGRREKFEPVPQSGSTFPRLAVPKPSVDELGLDLDKVRRHGRAHNDAEETLGSSAVAAPVRDAESNVAAAISLDLLDPFSTSNIDLHARAVVAAASRISAAIRRHALAAGRGRREVGAG